MKISLQLCVLLAVLFASLPVFAQTDEVIKVETSLIRLNVGVVDAQGRPQMNLARQNFTIYEDDVKQSISGFEPTQAPFSLVLLLDVSGSTKGFRELIVRSAARFVDALSPDDRVSVMEFNDKSETLVDFTTNRKDILYAVQLVGSQRKGGGTKLYKALDEAMKKLKKENTQRKAIVVLTDGIDSELEADDRRTVTSAKATTAETATAAINVETNPKLTSVLDIADKQGITVYPLALPSGDPKKLPDPLPFQVAKYTAARGRLQYLANRTGGSMNAINRLEDMGKLYAAVAAEIRTLYSVEYESTNASKRDGKWRKIRIEVVQPELLARTRPGYYAK